MSKKCPECKHEIEYVKVTYTEYRHDYMEGKEDDSGIYDEDCIDGDSNDSEDYEYFCPECDASLCNWDDLDNEYEEEDEQSPDVKVFNRVSKFLLKK